MVLLRDIATRAGTSVSTVSIVLGDRPSPVRISEATRQAVIEAARELGYTPNLAARRLRSSGSRLRTIVLGIAYPTDGRLSLISRVVAGVQGQINRVAGQLERVDVAVQLIVETFEPGHLKHLRGLEEALWFNGLLITNTTPEDDAYLEELESPVPIVMFQRYSQHSAVNTDSRNVGDLAGRHLVALGHRRLGLIYPTTGSQAQTLRIQGYRGVLESAGLDLGLVAPADGADWAAGAYAAANRLLESANDPHPTAIFATNDLLAIGALRAIRDHRLRIPDDVSLVGCDDAEFAAYLDPPLTTVRIPIEDMAARATTILLDLIFQRVTSPVHVDVPSTLVIRASTSPPASGAPRSSSILTSIRGGGALSTG